MTARDRGSVWEGWGVGVDRGVKIGYEERHGVGGHVSRSLDGRRGFGLSEVEWERRERERREIDEMLDEEWDSEEEEDEDTLVEDRMEE